MIIAVSLPAWAAERPGAISGYVRDVSGIPQMGAIVEVVGSAATQITVFTDAAGFYDAKDLLPGFYSVKVSAASFLPALREKVGLHPGTNVHLNITLSTLLNAMRVGPLRGTADDDDWKWTLRSVANRPVLRIFNDPADPEQQDHDTTGSLAFLAGSAASGYGSGSDMSTSFSVERSVFSSNRIGVRGNVGYGDNAPAAVLHASFTRSLPSGSAPTIALTMRRFAPLDANLNYAALQSLALSEADQVSIGDVVELRFGSEFQAIQFLGHVNSFRPYGSIDLHSSPNTVVEYDYTTSVPNSPDDKAFDSSSANPNGDQSADPSEANPRVSMTNFTTRLESAHHQEISVSHRMGKTSLQLAAFSDRVANTALIGTGNASTVGGYLLPDLYSGTFTYSGDTLDTNGLRVVLERKFCSDLTGTLDYAYGGVLDLARPDVQIQDVPQWISTERHHAVAAKLSGTLARTHTRWVASYRWIDGPALTPVDMFNASPGQTDPYLNLFIRQPIPTMGFLPAHMEALIDVRNLLAQGYVPVAGQDGQTVYLVQAARSIRGGLAISF